jgi:Fur family transcriptional regulator, ferric uptake regulator
LRRIKAPDHEPAHDDPAKPLTPRGRRPEGNFRRIHVPLSKAKPMTALKSSPALKATGIEARCAATGMRMTEQRRVIARVLAEAADHPDVEELYRRCVAVDDKISISTVYRTVKLFEDAGIIERHDFREGRARYEQMRDSHHDHLINLRDGKVIEFTNEEIEKLQAEIARKLGYKLVDHRLELYCVPLEDDKS